MSQQPGNGRFPLYPSLPTLNPIPIPSMPLPAPIPNYHLPYPSPSPNPNPNPNPIQSMPLSVPSLVGSDIAYPLPPATTSKRQREEESVEASGNEAVAAKRRAVVAQDVIFRVVVPSRQIGKVIGKEGCRIQKIREETKATIKIADAVVKHEERVIIISSKDSESKPTNAENALQQIAGLILKEDDTNTEVTKVGAVHVAANTIRLLIAGSQAGGLIGMSGQNIEKLRNACGATITVLPPNQLPLCASALESDRVVQISGDVPAVLKALEGIGQRLRENPPRQVISISPTYNYNLIRPAQPYVDPNSGQPILQLIMLHSIC